MNDRKTMQDGLHGFSVIHVSQGSVATYIRCGGLSA